MMTLLAWLLSISSGLMAGIYMTFSVVIMDSLAALESKKENEKEENRGVEVMTTINRHIVRTSFMPLFFGSTVVALLMIMTGLWHWDAPGGSRALVGGLVYLVGMFGVTVARNVPLNNQLDEVDGTHESDEEIWRHYLKHWTRWNTVRAVACVVSMVVCVDLLLQLPAAAAVIK